MPIRKINQFFCGFSHSDALPSRAINATWKNDPWVWLSTRAKRTTTRSPLIHVDFSLRKRVSNRKIARWRGGISRRKRRFRWDRQAVDFFSQSKNAVKRNNDDECHLPHEKKGSPPQPHRSNLESYKSFSSANFFQGHKIDIQREDVFLRRGHDHLGRTLERRQ